MATTKCRKIELLSPAKNLECGIAAIDHGADAVYIGASKFGARAAAGNPIEDIEALVHYAHMFRVKVYVTINTILKDEELEDTRLLICQLYKIGVDALIIQDMAIMQMEIPPIPLHASTQMNNCTKEKVKFLENCGFEQVVLARELSLNEIRTIHENSKVELEAFVHGALCVSYNGQCYASWNCFGRSANRGECAQFCRLAFNMTDADGNEIIHDQHLLSLKDLNQSNNIEKMLDAGISSLKIEGRLKDVSYVKNVTAYYRQVLDNIFSRRKEYERASTGKIDITFKPVIDKSFNRGFTDYFLIERHKGNMSAASPKSRGEFIGTVKNIGRGWFTIAGLKGVNNGDGLCYIDKRNKMQGFRVNKVVDGKIFPLEMPHFEQKTPVFRNFDNEFEQMMKRNTSTRKIETIIKVSETNWGFRIVAETLDGSEVSLFFEAAKEKARSPQSDNIKRQLSKSGNTPFLVKDVEINLTDNWFFPSSLLSEWKRQILDELAKSRLTTYTIGLRKKTAERVAFPESKASYRQNVYNKLAQEFYQQHGVKDIEPAFETERPKNVPIMYCKHCLRFEFGWCPNHQKQKSPFKEPFYLTSTDGHRFRLEFNCKECQMRVYDAT